MEVDIEVPNHLYDHFCEMSLLFCTSNIPYEEIGAHMQKHIDDNELSKEPRRLLVGGMVAKKVCIVFYYLIT